MTGARSPTFAVAVGRQNHVEVMHLCRDLKGSFSQKVAKFQAAIPHSLWGQATFVTHEIFLAFFLVWTYTCKRMVFRSFRGNTVHPCITQAVEECRLLQYIHTRMLCVGGNGEWAGLLENENSSKSTVATHLCVPNMQAVGK